MKRKKRLVLILLIVLIGVVIFYPVKKTNPTLENNKDYLAQAFVPENISAMVKTACYDCHSNTTDYPWYSHIAPFSWLISSHVKDGRAHVNFSEWQSLNSKNEKHTLEKCAEVIQEGEMPLNSYLLLHANARLSETERKALVSWFTNAAAQISYERQDE